MPEYIELKEAIDLFYSIDPENDGSDGGTVVLTSDDYTSEEIEEMLSLLPAADVAPVVHGERILDAKNHRHCSRCLYGRNIETQIGWNYCPACGAKMILEDS